VSLSNKIKNLAWATASVIAWCSTLLDVKGLYPDWDEEVGWQMAKTVQIAIVISWSIWLVAFFLKSKKRLNLWFKIGICFAVFWSIARLFFIREIVETVNYFSK